MAACNVLRRECRLPHIKSALALWPQHLLALAHRHQADDLTGGSLDRVDNVVTPGETPTGLCERIDPGHAAPAAIPGADPGRVRLMHQLDRGPRARLHTCGSRTAALLVFLQRRGNIVLRPCHHAGQRPGILDALAGALGEERHHRVGGVSDQGDPARGPAIDRIAIIHSGDEGGFDLIHHPARARFNVAERAPQIVDIAALGPGLAANFRRRNRGEDAVKLLRSNPIGDQGAAGPEPVIAALFKPCAPETLGRNQRAPHQNVGEDLFLRAPQMLAHERVDSVSANQGIAAKNLARLQPDFDAGCVLRDAGAFRIQMKRIRRQRIDQNLHKVGTMKVVKRRAVTHRRLVAKRRGVQHLAGMEVAIVV